MDVQENGRIYSGISLAVHKPSQGRSPTTPMTPTRTQKTDYICFAHSGLSHFTSLDWSISLAQQNIESPMSEAAGMMWFSYITRTFMCPWWYKDTLRSGSLADKQTWVSPAGLTRSNLMSKNMDFTEHHRPSFHLQRPLGSAFCKAACYCNISFIHVIWIFHWANIWPLILRQRRWNWSFIHFSLVQEEIRSAACRSKHAISNGDR